MEGGIKENLTIILFASICVVKIHTRSYEIRIPFTACTHIGCYNRKLKKQKTTKRNKITYIWPKCLL